MGVDRWKIEGAWPGWLAVTHLPSLDPPLWPEPGPASRNLPVLRLETFCADILLRRRLWQGLSAWQQAWAQAMANGESCEFLGRAYGMTFYQARRERAAILRHLRVETALALRTFMALLDAFPEPDDA